MKSLLIATVLLFSAQGFAAPQSVHMEGTMTFMSDMKAIPVELDLTLKKEKTDKSDYKGVLSYMEKGKQRARSIRLEIDRKDQETFGYGQMGFWRLEMEGGVISLSVGSRSSLHLALIREGRTECIPAPPPDRHVCYPGPDIVDDEGTLELKVISAQ